MQVFQQVQTGTTMNMRQVEADMRSSRILKMNQLLLNAGILKECEFVAAHMNPLTLSRILIKIVVFTEFVLVQQLVHHFAAFAAKVFALKRERCFGACFPAMEAGGLFL